MLVVPLFSSLTEDWQCSTFIFKVCKWKFVLKYESSRITPTSTVIWNKSLQVFMTHGWENMQPGLRPPFQHCDLQSAVRLNAHAVLSFVLGICKLTANFKLRGLHFCYSSSWMQWNYLIIHSLLSGRQTLHATLFPCLLWHFSGFVFIWHLHWNV